ncbi:MAG: GTPase Era [Ruminococcaceae bacterium]|nr:GTPase Era [Oscillospiraceae bacterium]
MKKTAFIAIVGRPNVGKSTLLNALLQEKVAIVSSKPQTTRNRITGILTKGDNQFVFLDTPGFQKPRTKLGDYMLKASKSSIGSSDAVVIVADSFHAPGDIEKNIIEQVVANKLPAILVLNKVDMSNPEKLALTIAQYDEIHKFDAVVPTSASKGDGVDIVLSECEKFLSPSEWFFPDDMITDQPERMIVAETIREKILRTLNDEIPHGTAVSIEEFKDEGKIIRVRADIYCEKDSHKGIIIGKKGASLKTIGSYAREDLERFFGVKVFIELWVKVKEKWRDSAVNLNNFGYNPKDIQ